MSRGKLYTRSNNSYYKLIILFILCVVLLSFLKFLSQFGFIIFAIEKANSRNSQICLFYFLSKLTVWIDKLVFRYTFSQASCLNLKWKIWFHCTYRLVLTFISFLNLATFDEKFFENHKKVWSLKSYILFIRYFFKMLIKIFTNRNNLIEKYRIDSWIF